jgi:hypothetical protein
MPPGLATSQLEFIRDMIYSKSLTASQMAEAAGCSERSIKAIRYNLRLFGSVRAPLNGTGRPWSITSIKLDALCDHLFEKPDLYLDEMVVLPWDEFRVLVTTFTIGRALRSTRWSKKAA